MLNSEALWDELAKKDEKNISNKSETKKENVNESHNDNHVRTIKDTMELERKFKDIKINEDIDYFLSGLSGDESIRNESMLELIKKLSDFNFLNAVTKSKALNNIIEKSIDLCRDHNSIYLSLCVCLILIKNDQFNSCSSSIITLLNLALDCNQTSQYLSRINDIMAQYFGIYLQDLNIQNPNIFVFYIISLFKKFPIGSHHMMYIWKIKFYQKILDLTIIKINQLNSISCTRSIENSFKFIIKMLSDCKASERELTIDLLSEKMVSAIHVYITESRYRHLFVKMFKILNIFVADESFRSKFELNNNIVLILIKILALVDTEEIYQDNDTFQLILSNLVSREFIQKISRIVFLKNQNVNKGYTPLEMDNISEYVGDFDHFEDNSFVPIHILYNTFKNLKASNSHFTKTIKCTEVQLQDNGSNEYFFDFLNDNDTNKSVDSKFTSFQTMLHVVNNDARINVLSGYLSILIAKLIQLMDFKKNNIQRDMIMHMRDAVKRLKSFYEKCEDPNYGNFQSDSFENIISILDNTFHSFN